MSERPKTYSIALRVRRVTHEDACVAVPVTDAIMRQNDDRTCFAPLYADSSRE